MVIIEEEPLLRWQAVSILEMTKSRQMHQESAVKALAGKFLFVNIKSRRCTSELAGPSCRPIALQEEVMPGDQ